MDAYVMASLRGIAKTGRASVSEGETTGGRRPERDGRRRRVQLLVALMHAYMIERSSSLPAFPLFVTRTMILLRNGDLFALVRAALSYPPTAAGLEPTPPLSKTLDALLAAAALAGAPSPAYTAAAAGGLKRHPGGC